MLTSQRKQETLGLLKRDGQVIAKELSQRFAVSEDTIRRDLRELAAEGLLQRVHGGALLNAPAEADFAVRQTIAPASKVAVAKAAARMIAPGQIVLLDGGTTAVQLVRHLPADLRATIVTHSPSIAVELVNHPGIETIVIGGRLFRHSIVTVGAAAIEALGHVRADLFFMGVTGVHPVAGLTTGDLEEAYMKRALSAHAAETVVLASAEKINAASAYRIAAVTAAGTIIVENDTPESATDPLAALGVTIIRA
jgi:DeoR/GlpR family transcriptional regulator of sugar metabolism